MYVFLSLRPPYQLIIIDHYISKCNLQFKLFSPIALRFLRTAFGNCPTAVNGGARSQFPECGAAAERNRAWSRGPLALSRSSFPIFLATILSHSFCFPCLAYIGTSLAVSFFLASTVLTFNLSTWLCNLTGRMSFWIYSVQYYYYYYFYFLFFFIF